MKRLIHINRKYVFIVVTLLVCSLMMAGVSFGESKRMKQWKEEAKEIPLPIVKVTIVKKTLQGVVTKFGDQYAVDEATIIIGSDGRQVKYTSLLTPCDVELTVGAKKSKNSRNVAEWIKILNVQNGAVDHFTAVRPD